MVQRYLVAAVAAVALGAGLAQADEIIFNNGDRLTGTIKEATGGKLVIDTAVAGTVSVDMKQVKTFTADKPVELKIGEGNVLKTTVAASPEAGKIQAAGGGGVAPQTVAVADIQAINPPPVKWTGAISANALITRGNTKTDNVGVSIEAIRRDKDDRITFNAGYLYGRQETDDGGMEVTTDNWFVFGKYDYFFTKKFYGYGSTRVERDRIAELDLRVMPSAGVGYQWWEKPETNFSTEAGIAWVYEDYSNGDSEDYISARFAYKYDRKINDKVLFFHSLEFFPSLEDASEFLLLTDAGVRVTLTKRMFTEFKFQWQHDTDPAPGAEKNDLRYILGVGWTF